jgi:hypothetical protein
MFALDEVATLRSRLWNAGFLPVAVYNYNAPPPVKHPGKQPKGREWQKRARSDPPAAVILPPEIDALNTGILCDSLRVFDIDIDYPSIARQIREIIECHLGNAPVRYRTNSPHTALVYRDAEGSPHKRVLKGKFGKIEVLGHGQQLAAFGFHETGVQLEWTIAPGQIHANELPPVTEAQIDALFGSLAPLIGAEPSTDDDQRTKLDREIPRTSYKGQKADDSLRVVAALMAIPNNGAPDWEFFNRVGMATFAATGGSQAGFAAFCAWSEKNPGHDPLECRERWQNYHKSPPTVIGAGTLFYMAGKRSRGRRHL